MRVFITSATLALSAIRTCWASAPLRAIEARQAPVVQFFFEGPFISVAQGYESYSISVPEDGSTVPISNQMIVLSIIPSDVNSDCLFVGVDGATHRVNGYQQDLFAEALASVTCLARSGPVVTPTGFPNFSSFFPNRTAVATSPSVASTGIPFPTQSLSTAAITSLPAGTGSGIVPPYPTGTGSSLKLSITPVSASAPSGTATATGVPSTSTTVPFTGDAARATGSLLTSLLAFIGLIAAL